eukprot:1161345-Pelagomonas_calceolata.AAC.22
MLLALSSGCRGVELKPRLRRRCRHLAQVAQEWLTLSPGCGVVVNIWRWCWCLPRMQGSGGELGTSPIIAQTVIDAAPQLPPISV